MEANNNINESIKVSSGNVFAKKCNNFDKNSFNNNYFSPYDVDKVNSINTKTRESIKKKNKSGQIAFSNPHNWKNRTEKKEKEININVTSKAISPMPKMTEGLLKRRRHHWRFYGK